MIRTQISMTEEQAEGLRRLAAVRNQSQAALLRDALDGMLSGQELELRAEAARSVVGRHGSGRADIAEDHDAALEAAFGA